MRMFVFKIGAGCNDEMWPDKGHDGFKFSVGYYTFTFRKRYEHEILAGESRRWWRSERGGLYDTLYFPVGGWCLDGFRGRLSYAEAVGFKQSLDWVIDEFDASFNDLAVASMRYHMDWSVCYCDDERRAKYESMIARLSEPAPDTTPEEHAAIETWDMFSGEMNEDGSRTVPPCPPEAGSAFDSWQERLDAHKDRISAARIEFVRDILPGLWS